MSNSDAMLDPMRAWRDWFVKNEREWSESLAKAMQDENVARTLGLEINASLHRKQMFSKEMASAMANMNLPTRDDIVALGERVGQLEDAIARLEAALVQTKRGGAADAAKPARTRKPPPKTKAKAGR
jgi:polyhydroxyalkanoate synthesis regulator phasin